jgi:hypothetical protein
VANLTKTVLDSAGFIPQNWANQALLVLRNQIAVLPTVARDTDFTDPGWKGKQLNIPYPGTFTAIDKTPGSLATVQSTSGGSSVALSLTQHKTVDFMLEDAAVSQAQSGTGVMEAFGQAAGVAIAEQVEKDLLGQFTGFTLGSLVNNGTNGTNLSAATVQTMQKILDDAKTPNMQRYLMISTKDRNAILADTNLTQWYAFAQQNAIGNGQVPNLYGFNLNFSQLLPSADGSAATGILHAVQTATINNTTTGGTFTLTYNAQTTVPIALKASAATVANALAALSTIGAGNVGVTLDATGFIYTISIFNNLTPLALTGSAAGLTGGVPTLTLADVTTGATSKGQVNLAYHKNAFMFASRPLMQVDETAVRVGTVNDPVSGLSLRVQFQYRADFRALYVAYDILYGMTALRPNQGLMYMS